MLWLSAVAFYVLGIVLVLLGVLQAEMTRGLGLTLAQHGLLGALLALGFGVGLTLGGPLVDRLPRKVLFVGACAVAAFALLAVDGAMAYARVAAHVALLGIGGGCYITLLNAAVIDRYGTGAARRLAFVHASATAGAGSGPWLIAWAQGAFGGGWPGTFRVLGALYLMLALLGSMWRFPEPRTLSATQAQSPMPVSALLRSPTLYLIALAIFAYVGVENGLTLLAVPWAIAQGVDESEGRTAISAFWLALMAGRTALMFWPRPPAASLLVACGVAGVLALGIALLASWSPVIALAAAGIALGPVYPATIALTGKYFSRSTGAALGLVSGAGACGGFVMPWLSGALGDMFSVSASIALLAAGAALLASVALALPAPSNAYDKNSTHGR